MTFASSARFLLAAFAALSCACAAQPPAANKATPAAATPGMACAAMKIEPDQPPALPNRVESKDLADVGKLLADAPPKTLLVLDIDDTLLTSSVFFGSDAWYEWQKRLEKEQPQHEGLVPCRFDVIAMNTEVGRQKTTQDGAVQIINGLMGRFDTLMLTSRNSGARAATIRELTLRKYDLPRHLWRDATGIAFRYKDPGEGVDREVTVSYDQGIVMSEGKNKGNVLNHLLGRLNVRYDRVVLVDDGLSNHANMSSALAAAGVEYRGLWYRNVNKDVDAQECQAGVDAWKRWSELIRNNYPERWLRLAAAKCAAKDPD